MASLNADKNGNRRIQFRAPDGKRKTIYLGKLPKRQAQTVKGYVERLIVAAVSGDSIDADTARWLKRITEELHNKLAGAGLVSKRQSARLQDFLDSYIKSRTDVKGSTATVYGHTRRCLVDYFGTDKPLHEITQGDADRWRLWLATDQDLADNTVRRRCGIAKQFFKAAVRHRLIDQNPFADLVAAVRRNQKRYYFISREDAQRVIDACPDAQWRLLFAMARYGGLRIPSEALRLTWGDVDWERGRITVHSPKTEHHPGGESRQIPLFPELRPYLEEIFEQAEPGTEHVVTRYRDPSTNLRTQLQKIIRRAGVEPWPKLWQNLRSTRETELAEIYPIHVVCDWIGNSQAVAAKHYLQVTDDHFAQATGEPGKATQNPTHAAPVRGRKASHKKGEDPAFAEVSKALLTCTTVQVGAPGLEPGTSSLSGTRSNQLSYAPDGTLDSSSPA
jgi:integrase